MPRRHSCRTLLAAWLLGAVCQLVPSIASGFSSAVKTTGDSSSCEVDKRQGNSLTIGSCDNAGINRLLQGMSEWSNLASISLELRYNGLGDAGVEQLATQLSSSPTKSSLTTLHLDLYGNLLGVQSVKHLTAALLDLPKLLNLTLRLGGNHLGDIGMEHLVSATCRMRHLSTMLLDISYNNISKFLAWPSTGRCLSNLKKLDIFLGWNVLGELPDISRLGACQLTNLTELVVDAQSQSRSSKSIFKVGRTAAPDDVCSEQSSSLRSLEIILLGNQLEDNDVLQLLVVMSSMEALESIVLWVGSGEQDGVANLDNFAEMLTVNLPSLSTLVVNGKQLSLPKRSSTAPTSTTSHRSASEASGSVVTSTSPPAYTSSNMTTSSISYTDNTSATQNGKDLAKEPGTSGHQGSWTMTWVVLLVLCCCACAVVVALTLRSRFSRPPEGVLRVSDGSESDDACHLVSWTFSENDPDDRPRRAVAPPGSVAAATAGVAAAATAARTPPLRVSMDAAAQLQIHLMGDPTTRHGD